jgi:hypothetical protein
VIKRMLCVSWHWRGPRFSVGAYENPPVLSSRGSGRELTKSGLALKKQAARSEFVARGLTRRLDRLLWRSRPNRACVKRSTTNGWLVETSHCTLTGHLPDREGNGK